MLIEEDSARRRRGLIAGVLFLVIMILIKLQNASLNVVDAVLQALFTNHHLEQSGAFHFFMTALSAVSSPKLDIIWILIIAFLLWGFRFRIPALWSLCTLAGADILGTIVKHIVKRARPAQHLAGDNGYSFPSGHVLSAFIVAAVLFLIVIPLVQNSLARFLLQLLLILWMLFLAVSRVYLYAHWPLDTIGAMLLAYTWLQIAEWLYVKWAPGLQRSFRLFENTYI